MAPPRIILPSGPTKPTAPKGYTAVGVGHGRWMGEKSPAVVAPKNKVVATKKAASPTPTANWLAPLSNKQVTKQATNIVASEYKPQFTDLNNQVTQAKNLDAKRASDQQSYDNWLASQGAALQAANAGIITTLEHANAQTQEAANAGVTPTAGVGGPQSATGSANADWLSTMAAQNAAKTANTIAGSNNATAIGSTGVPAATANAFAEQSAVRAKQISDLDNALANATTARAKLHQSQTADTAKEIAALQNVEVQKAQNQENYQAAAAKLGLTTANTNSEIATRAANVKIAGINANTALTRAQQAQENSDRTYQLNVKKLGLSTAKDLYERQHGLGPYRPSAKTGTKKPLSTSSSNTLFSNIDNAKNTLADMVKNGRDASGNPITPQEAYHILASGGTYYVVAPSSHYSTKNGTKITEAPKAVKAKQVGEPILLNAAYNLYRFNALNTKDLAALNNQLGLYGVRARYTVKNHLVNPPNVSASTLGNF